MSWNGHVSSTVVYGGSRTNDVVSLDDYALLRMADGSVAICTTLSKKEAGMAHGGTVLMETQTITIVEYARILHVLYGADGRRFRPVLADSALMVATPFCDWPLEDPRTSEKFRKPILQTAPPFSSWHTKWMAERLVPRGWHGDAQKYKTPTAS